MLALGLLTLARLAVAATLPLSPDEAYYWVWSRALAPGYFDHPPMVALWIAAGTAVAGDTALGVRLLAPLATALGSVLLARAAESLLPGRHAGIAAAVLLNATLVLGVGSVTMTPDTPLLLFWTATLWALARLLETGDGRWWLVAGVAAGLAADSKYTGFLLAPVALAWVLLGPGLRHWLRRWQPWAAAALGVAVFAPVLAWNAAHGWASFLRQGGRAADWRPARAAQFVAELVGGQVGLATPLLAVLFAAGSLAALRLARRGRWLGVARLRDRDPRRRVPPARAGRPGAGELAVGLLPPPPAIAAAGLAPRWHGWRAPAVGLGAALTALVWFQGTTAALPLPRALDPTLIRLGGWATLGRDIDAVAARTGAAYVASDVYGLAAMLAWTLPRGRVVLGADPRWALFALPKADPGAAPGLLVRSTRRAASADPAVATLVRARGGVAAETYRLYLGLIERTAVAVLPRPR